MNTLKTAGKKINRWAIGILILIALLAWTPLSTLTRKVFRNTLSPLEQVSNQSAREANALLTRFPHDSKRSREQLLSLELVKTQTELNRLRDIERENLQLRKALGFQQASPYSLTPVTVISRSLSGWWNTLRVMPGQRTGITKDCAVLNPDGLVGRTLQVYASSADILLISDPAFRVAASVSNRNIAGIVQGLGSSLQGRPRAEIKFMNKDAYLEVGDRVVTSGSRTSSTFFPPGIPIGYIKEIIQDANGLYQSAGIELNASTHIFDYLFVVQTEGARP